jgi:hypothetical protein
MTHPTTRGSIAGVIVAAVGTGGGLMTSRPCLTRLACLRRRARCSRGPVRADAVSLSTFRRSGANSGFNTLNDASAFRGVDVGKYTQCLFDREGWA